MTDIVDEKIKDLQGIEYDFNMLRGYIEIEIIRKDEEYVREIIDD